MSLYLNLSHGMYISTYIDQYQYKLNTSPRLSMNFKDFNLFIADIPRIWMFQRTSLNVMGYEPFNRFQYFNTFQPIHDSSSSFKGFCGLVVMASGWQSFDCRFDPYLHAFMAASLWCGLGCRS
jgi:hypothetical protein